MVGGLLAAGITDAGSVGHGAGDCSWWLVDFLLRTRLIAEQSTTLFGGAHRAGNLVFACLNAGYSQNVLVFCGIGNSVEIACGGRTEGGGDASAGCSWRGRVF